MSRSNKETPELDIVGLLSLKAFEQPNPERIEKGVQSTMQAVRVAHKRPSLHLFPDKSMAWMFAQPRYGIAALFILFLGLHLVRQPLPTEALGAGMLEEPSVEMDIANVVATNLPSAIAIPEVTPNYSSLIQPVSFSE